MGRVHLQDLSDLALPNLIVKIHQRHFAVRYSPFTTRYLLLARNILMQIRLPLRTRQRPLDARACDGEQVFEQGA